MTPFILQPFPGHNSCRDFSLCGKISRENNICKINYELTGPLASLRIPSPTTTTERRDKLWQKTCFEMFWKTPEDSNYWELNLSPTGHWNVYAFNDYRKGMQQEKKICGITMASHRTPVQLTIDLTIELSPLLPHVTLLDLGINAILEHDDQTKSFWALAHGTDKPDFHQQKYFPICL